MPDGNEPTSLRPRRSMTLEDWRSGTKSAPDVLGEPEPVKPTGPLTEAEKASAARTGMPESRYAALRGTTNLDEYLASRKDQPAE